MEQTITLTIPASWLGNQSLSSEDLRQAVLLGLQQLRRQPVPYDATRIIQTLLKTGRVHHLTTANIETPSPRQTPPTLPGMPTSELLIAQRGRDL